ncbi:hypothetical protein QQ045_008485 [Rhodiola kirilowii]
MSFQDLQGGAGRRPASNLGRNVQQNSSQAVAAGIFQINTSVSGFRRLVDAIGTVKDTPDLRLKLHNTRQRVLQLVKETSTKLKALSESDRGSNVNASKKIEDAKLARDFHTILQEFQNVQQLASERESTYAPSVPPSSIPEEQELVLLDNEIGFNDAMIDEREQGIREIQEQIGEANEIFKDLAVLVHDQGVTIDDIHSNIEASSSATNQAKVQLVKASKSVKSRSSWATRSYAKRTSSTRPGMPMMDEF